MSKIDTNHLPTILTHSGRQANVGERACDCRGARIPEEGAQRLTRLYWVLGEVEKANLDTVTEAYCYL